MKLVHFSSMHRMMFDKCWAVKYRCTRRYRSYGYVSSIICMHVSSSSHLLFVGRWISKYFSTAAVSRIIVKSLSSRNAYIYIYIYIYIYKCTCDLFSAQLSDETKKEAKNETRIWRIRGVIIFHLFAVNESYTHQVARETKHQWCINIMYAMQVDAIQYFNTHRRLLLYY